MIIFDKVDFDYINNKGNNINIVSDLSFHISKGEFVSIVGSSGSGKSTIIKLAAQLLKPKSGIISTAKIAYMPQNDLLLDWRTVIDNIVLPLELIGMDCNQAKSMGMNYLREFSLCEFSDYYPKDLSGGMRQRVSFIRTFLVEAEALLLDEPFSALDYITRVRLQDWFRVAVGKFNKTVLLITHDIDEAIKFSDRIFLVVDNPISRLVEYNVESYFKNDDILKIDILNMLGNS